MKEFLYPAHLGDLKKALDEAFDLKQNRYKYEHLGKHKTALLIFFNNSLRTRLSTQKAAMNLGMNVIVLDVNQGAWKLETERGVVMDGDKSEHLLEAIPVLSSYCDIIGVRTFARLAFYNIATLFQVSPKVFHRVGAFYNLVKFLTHLSSDGRLTFFFSFPFSIVFSFAFGFDNR